MSTIWTITANDNTLYTVVTDVTANYWAVITGVVTDEILGGFNLPTFTVALDRKDLLSKTAGQGLYAVTGYPTRSFPQLSSTSYKIDLTLEAPGFQDYPLQVTIPVNATFPVSAPAVALRRLPVRLQGRVVKDATGQPVVGAVVVSVDNPNPPSPPPPPPIAHTMLLRSPLYSAHAKSAPVQQATIAKTGSAQFTQAVAAGAAVLPLSSTAGLSAGSILQIQTPTLALVEYAIVKNLGPAAEQVTLTNPLKRSYGALAATNVNFVTATLSGSVANLLLDADAGDGIVIADQLLQVGTLVIDAGNPAVEYHELGAVTDSNGYYALNGLGRVQELFLEANAPGTPVVPWVIEFDQATNIVDFRI